MPYRSYVFTRSAGYGYTLYPDKLNYSWSRGNRAPNGALILRDNGLTHERWRVRSWSPNGPQAASFLPNAADPNLCWRWNDVRSAENRLLAESYARLRGKLYKGSAALGVTLGSWKQSREMISNRYRQINGGLDRMISDIATLNKQVHRKQYHRLAKRLAGTHLEIIFGWRPLFQDILAAATTVISDQPQAQRLSAKAQTAVRLMEVWGSDGYARTYWTGSGWLSIKRGVTVEIANPNVWLLERAGLLNVASVGWDLVPWSFVLNWFVNVNQLVASITDFAGLDFPSSSTTYRLNTNYSVVSAPGRLNADPKRNELYGKAEYSCHSKYRYKNGVARPPLVLKLPNVDWSLAAIAASLCTQKLGKVSAFLQK